MTFKFSDTFEDAVTEHVTALFADIPAEEKYEPIHLTNDRLPALADSLGAMARKEGCATHFSVPNVKDNWEEFESEPSSYTVTVKWFGVAGQPEFVIPVLPRGAA